MRRFLPGIGLALALSTALPTQAQTKEPDWKAVNEETMRHFQALLRMDTSDPPGNEAPAVEYLKAVLQKEGIEVKTFGLEANRPNLVARLKGNGKKRPLLLMGHTDVVTVDPTKWTYPPFSATRKDGYVYGRGSLDDKPHVVNGLMMLLLLKRLNVKLERDIIFLAEAGEEGNSRYGIEYMVKEHWPDIDAEYCFAEGGGVARTGGKILYGGVQTTEKVPRGLRLVAKGISGHGSVPLRSNSIVHLSNAVAKVAAWQTPMRLNETTTAFFQRLAEISSPEDAARYRTLVSGNNTEVVQEYLAVNVPRYYSTLHTSVSPNIIKGGYRSNVIPSEAEATLDVRALPDEDMPRFIEQMKQVINDPQVEILPNNTGGSLRPAAKPSGLNTEAFKVIEAALKRHYNTIALPIMTPGATDMAFLRDKGVQCYGVGLLTDTEEGPKGFGAHSDQERILEESLYKFIHFHWDVIKDLATKSGK
jgi:acetylornithine deacetylase/succinyl-diaminopimelate desuccinylase-like protein